MSVHDLEPLADTPRLSVIVPVVNEAATIQACLTALSAQRGPALLIGSDCPVLTPALLARCVRALNAHDLVMLPAEDGGYALIGGHRLPARLFTDMAWGGSEVAAQTLARARELGLRVACPGTVWDLDTPRDLERWRMLDSAT